MFTRKKKVLTEIVEKIKENRRITITNAVNVFSVHYFMKLSLENWYFENCILFDYHNISQFIKE